MPLKELFSGNKFSIKAWVQADETCETEDFIRALQGTNNPDAGALTHLMETTAKHGMTNNEQKIRHIHGSLPDLYEFKARGGSRILFVVYREENLIVCSHGVPKLKDKRFKREVKKLEETVQDYEYEILEEESSYVN